MIDIQDETEFACQVLNRDIWSNTAVKSIIEEHFVFWQVNRNSREGQRYMQFYPIEQFPHVAILDPRTGMLALVCVTPCSSLPLLFAGEKLNCWSAISDSNMFCELVTDFLQEHLTPSGERATGAQLPNDEQPTVGLTKRQVGEMSEEEQLHAAIAASLREPIKVGDDEDDVDDIETFSSDDDTPVEVVNHVHNNAKATASAALVKMEQQEMKVKVKTEGAVAAAAATKDDHTQYLGHNDEMADLVLRFPDGRRERLTVPSDSKLKVGSLLSVSAVFHR